MKTHLLLYRMDKDLYKHQGGLSTVPVAACHVKYSVMAQLKVKSSAITCRRCKREAKKHERWYRWFNSPAGQRWQQGVGDWAAVSSLNRSSP